MDYDGFGNLLNETNPANGDRFKFTGREYDATTGLQYNRARYYDPSTGRWISQDPLGLDSGDTNLYRYVGNRPTIATDPLGLELVVGDKTITTDSDLYKKYEKDPFAKEILDSLIGYKGSISFPSTAAFENEIKIRQAFAKCIANLQKNKVKFGGDRTAPDDSKWRVVQITVTRNGRRYNAYQFVYDGDDPSAGLDALLSKNTALDCANAAVLCELMALRDTLGPKAFNDLFKGKRPSSSGRTFLTPASKPPPVLLPGDRVYFPNYANYERLLPGRGLARRERHLHRQERQGRSPL